VMAKATEAARFNPAAVANSSQRVCRVHMGWLGLPKNG
jgi:hypothetical protein